MSRGTGVPRWIVTVLDYMGEALYDHLKEFSRRMRDPYNRQALSEERKGGGETPGWLVLSMGSRVL